MKWALLIFLGIPIVIAIWFGESRKFYHSKNGNYVTVWKTYNDVCYVVPGKYYGLVKPTSRNYIKTSNLSNVNIIWVNSSKNIIVTVDDSAKIVNQSNVENELIDYNLHKAHNDSLFLYFDGKYHRYKKGVDYLTLFIDWNWAVDGDGKRY